MLERTSEIKPFKKYSQLQQLRLVFLKSCIKGRKVRKVLKAKQVQTIISRIKLLSKRNQQTPSAMTSL